MAAFDTVEASHLMLEIVNPRIAQAFEQDTSMWNLLSQGKAADTNSRGVRIVAYVQPNPSIGWLAESSPFPNSGKPTHVEMNVKYVRAYKVGEITGDVKDLDGRNQIARYIATAVSETTQNFKKEIVLAEAQHYKKLADHVWSIVADRMNISVKQFNKRFLVDKWFGAKEAVAVGLADKIL